MLKTWKKWSLILVKALNLNYTILRIWFISSFKFTRNREELHEIKQSEAEVFLLLVQKNDSAYFH